MVNDEAVRLGEELASARRAAGRSLRDVAQAAGISAAYLQKLERSAVKGPSPRVLGRLAAALGISYGRLMQAAGYGGPKSEGPVVPLATKFAAAGLTETEERAVAAFIDRLLAQRRQLS